MERVTQRTAHSAGVFPDPRTGSFDLYQARIHAQILTIQFHNTITNAFTTLAATSSASAALWGCAAIAPPRVARRRVRGSLVECAIICDTHFRTPSRTNGYQSIVTARRFADQSIQRTHCICSWGRWRREWWILISCVPVFRSGHAAKGGTLTPPRG